MNKDLLKPISEVKPKYALTQKQLLIQNRTEKSILYAMDEDTYEELVTSWAYLCLDGQYDQTYRIGGTGDHGIDVLAVIAGQPNRYHIYQCKHYSESLKPSTVYPEVCKILYHIFKGSIPTPEKYFIIAPKDLTPQLIEDYTDKSKLRNTIQSNWHKYSKNIVNGIIIHLDHELSSFIDSFDFRFDVACIKWTIGLDPSSIDSLGANFIHLSLRNGGELIQGFLWHRGWIGNIHSALRE